MSNHRSKLVPRFQARDARTFLITALVAAAGAAGCGPPPDSPAGAGQSFQTISSKASGSVVYSGTISGNAYVKVMPTSTTSADLYIVGMKVEVRMKDAGSDSVVGTGVTGEGGRFDIPYRVESPASEADLYLHFVAETGDGMIRVRKKGVVDKWSRNQDLFKDTPIVVSSAMPTFSIDKGKLELDSSELKPQLLHWANRARQFVTAALGSDSPLPMDPATPLDILTPPLFFGAQTFFVPATSLVAIVKLIAAGLIPIGPLPAGGIFAYVQDEFSDQDALYVSTDSEQDDGTTMHEFGHYVMWYAQGKKWLNPLQASFAHHYEDLNSANSKIAWTEGFADGFARIVDAWSYMDDGESDSDTPTYFPDTPGLFGTPKCGSGAGTTCNDQATSHGFFSELYIDHVVYDLWDGPTALTSGPNAATRVIEHWDYDDDWADAIELSFADIMRPILDTKNQAQSALVQNIVDYHSRLYALQNNRAIKDLFVGKDGSDGDKIRNLLAPFPPPASLLDLPNTDAISFDRDVEVELYKVDDATGTIVKSTGTQVERFTVDVPGLYTSMDDYNLGATASNGGMLTLSDDLVVDGAAAAGHATLRFNQRTRPIGWQATGNTYAAPTGTTTTTASSLAVTVASGTHLLAQDRGTIILGEPANGQQATVTVAAGGTLELGGGLGGDYPERDPKTGQVVSKGNVFINRGSKLIIERGATLKINPGAQLTLDGRGAELIIRGNLVLSDSATFWWTATNGAMVTFDLDGQDGAPNVTFGQNAQILVDEVEFTVASGTYVRPPEGIPGAIVMRNGARGHLGSNAYINASHDAVTLTDSTIDLLSGSTPHLGVVLNGGPNTIRGMTFSGGQRCLQETLPGTPLIVVDSTFVDCTLGVDVTTTDMILQNVTMTGGDTGVQTSSPNRASIVDSQITAAKTGWHLTNRGPGGQGLENTVISGIAQAAVLIDGTNPTGAPAVSISDSTVGGSAIGVASVGNSVRILRSTVQNNAIGVKVSAGALLDLSRSASAQFTGNTTSIALDGAAKPLLDGSNRFYPKTRSTTGTALSGTIDEPGPCTTTPRTITATSDDWEVWNVGAGAYLAQPLSTSPYSLQTVLGCPYTLVP